MVGRNRAYLATPIGWLAIGARDSAITHADWVGAPPRVRDEPKGVLAECAAQLDEYFRGARRSFSVALAPAGTAFQREVWSQLLRIGYGTTTTYAQMAAAIGRPRAARAVGHANGRNPISVLIPCHRVVGSDGTLTGYGGGLWRKEWLLQHEMSGDRLVAPPLSRSERGVALGVG